MRRCRNRSPESSPKTNETMHKLVSVRWRRPIWLVVFAFFLFSFLLYHSSHLLKAHKKRLALLTQEFGYRIAEYSFVDHHKIDRDHDRNGSDKDSVSVTDQEVEEDSVSSDKDKDTEQETTVDDAVSKEESTDQREDDEKSEDGVEVSDSGSENVDAETAKNGEKEANGKLAADDENVNRTVTLANEKGSAKNVRERVAELLPVGEKQKQASVEDAEEVDKIDVGDRVGGDEKQKQSSVGAEDVEKIDAKRVDENNKQGSVQDAEEVEKFDDGERGSVQDGEDADKTDAGERVSDQLPINGDEKQKQGSVQNAEDVDKNDVGEKVGGDENEKQDSVKNGEDADKIDAGEGVSDQLPVNGDEKLKQGSVLDTEEMDKINTGEKVGDGEKLKQGFVQDKIDVGERVGGGVKQKQGFVQDIKEVGKIDDGERVVDQLPVHGDEKQKQGSVLDAEEMDKINTGEKVGDGEKLKQGSVQDKIDAGERVGGDVKQKKDYVQDIEEMGKIDVERVVDKLPVHGDEKQKQGSAAQDAEDVDKIDARERVGGEVKQKQDEVDKIDADSVQDAEDADKIDAGERVGGDEKHKQGSAQDAEEVDKIDVGDRVDGKLPVGDENPRQGSVKDPRKRKNPKKKDHLDVIKRVGNENQNQVSGQDIQKKEKIDPVKIVDVSLAVDDANSNRKSKVVTSGDVQKVESNDVKTVSEKESKLDHPKIPKGKQNRAPTVKSNKQPPRKDKESCKGRYIYIHELPDRFNEDMIKNCHSLSKWLDMFQYIANFGLGPQLNNALKEFSRGGWFATNQFTLEVIFHHRMRQYKCLTTDSSKASAIYLPYYAGLDVSRYLWFDRSLKDSASLDLVNWLREKPEWKRMWGRDHFFVAGRITWDFRREVANWKNWGNKLMLLPEAKNMTILTIESSPWNRNDFGIPYPSYFHPKNDVEIRTWQSKVRRMKRRYLFCFAGAPRPNLRNSIRGEIIKQCQAAKRKCRLLECLSGNKCYQPVNVMKMFESSIFCLQPPGDSFTRRSTFDSILAGCIPVFFHPGSAYVQYIWHFPKDYNKYSIWIPGSDVKEGKVNIEEFLQNIPQQRVTVMREQLIRLIPKITYADPGFQLETYEDAFDIAVNGVLDRIERSRREMQEGKNISFSFNEENAWKFYTYGTQRKHEWDVFFDRSKNKDLRNQ